MSPPSNVLLKEFAPWCKSRDGQLEKMPILTAVRDTVKKFLSGFQRVTKTKIPDQLRTDVHTSRPWHTIVKQLAP